MPKTNNYLWKTADNHLSSNDKTMAELIRKFGPCTLIERQDYFPLLCQSIISQQLSSKAAMTIFNRFSANFPDGLDAKTVSQASFDSLRGIGLSRQKIAYINDLSQRVVNKQYNFSHYKYLSAEDIISELTATKGIGLWTAQMFLMFAVNHPDILPHGDLGILKAVQQHYLLDGLPNKACLEEIATPWQPYRTVACWYLWRSTDDLASSW